MIAVAIKRTFAGFRVSVKFQDIAGGHFTEFAVARSDDDEALHWPKRKSRKAAMLRQGHFTRKTKLTRLDSVACVPWWPVPPSMTRNCCGVPREMASRRHDYSGARFRRLASGGLRRCVVLFWRVVRICQSGIINYAREIDRVAEHTLLTHGCLDRECMVIDAEDFGS